MPESTMLVRIKPFNPRKGYVMKTYAVDHPEFGSARFLESQGWYEVTPGMAGYLENLNSQPGNNESPAAFDVCTREEAIKLEERERRNAREKADASNATRVHSTLRDVQERQRGSDSAVGTLTTADLGDDEDGGHQVKLNGVRNVPMQTEPKHGTQADIIPRRIPGASNLPGAPAPVGTVRRPGRAAPTEGSAADLDSDDLSADVAAEERRSAKAAGRLPGAPSEADKAKHPNAAKAAQAGHGDGKTGESAGGEHRASHTGEKHK